MTATVVSTLLQLAADALAAATGGGLVHHAYSVGYVDGFGVDSSDLTDEHRTLLDAWIAGEKTGGFPFVPGSADHRIVLVAGLASQTGPESHNVELGLERAEAVYDYLVAGLGTSQIDENIQSVGSSRPRAGFDHPGEEHPENRAVGIVVERTFTVVTAPPPPPPADDPPPPASRQWEMTIAGVFSFADPIPILDAVGGQAIVGRLRNVRTDETQAFVIRTLGINAGASVVPIDVSVNLDQAHATPFPSHWTTFDDFDDSTVFFVGVGAADVYEASAGAIGFLANGAIVEPSGFTIKTNISAAAQLQYGDMTLLGAWPPSWWPF